MAYLGVVPDYAGGDGNGLRLTDVNADSPAGKGGLQAGDVIIRDGEVVEACDRLGIAMVLTRRRHFRH